MPNRITVLARLDNRTPTYAEMLDLVGAGLTALLAEAAASVAVEWNEGTIALPFGAKMTDENPLAKMEFTAPDMDPTDFASRLMSWCEAWTRRSNRPGHKWDFATNVPAGKRVTKSALSVTVINNDGVKLFRFAEFV